MGNEPRFAGESLLVQTMVRMLKAQAWPECRDVENWLADSMRFHGDAPARFVRYMRPRFDLACARGMILIDSGAARSRPFQRRSMEGRRRPFRRPVRTHSIRF